jgi:uncharacterized membrane protein
MFVKTILALVGFCLLLVSLYFVARVVGRAFMKSYYEIKKESEEKERKNVR